MTVMGVTVGEIEEGIVEETEMDSVGEVDLEVKMTGLICIDIKLTYYISHPRPLVAYFIFIFSASFSFFLYFLS